MCSALFSGLTLGLLSLDPSSLTILAEAGDAQERKYAKQIIPLRKNGNLLLCTLLIGNVIVNSFLSILLADIAGGAIGGIISTALIVVFGEIAPQAVCSRHGLYIGSKTRYITWLCVVVLYVLAWPISKILDCLLGREVGLMYSREELKHLLKMQVVAGKRDPEEDGIDVDDHDLLAGTILAGISCGTQNCDIGARSRHGGDGCHGGPFLPHASKLLVFVWLQKSVS